MKKPRILVTSVQEAVKYVLKHIQYEYAKKTDTYAVISIQDPGGFGFEFTEGRYCKGVLTLYFDDVEEAGGGCRLINKSQAKQIINFIQEHQDVDTLLIHCYAGVSRSRAVGVFAREMLNIPPTKDVVFNDYVYFLLVHTAEELKESEEQNGNI